MGSRRWLFSAHGRAALSIETIRGRRMRRRFGHRHAPEFFARAGRSIFAKSWGGVLILVVAHALKLCGVWR